MSEISKFKTNSQFFVNTKSEKVDSKPKESTTKPMSNTSKLALGFVGLTAIAASGVYIARGKKPNTNINLRDLVSNVIQKEKPLSNAGLKGIVYKFEHKGEPYVAKVARSTEHSFGKEKEILEKIPQELESSQKLVDYYQLEDGRDVLISTFVDGKQGILKSKEQFDNLFDSLLELDNAGVLHNDLGMGNCVFKDGKVKLIDYGEGALFKIGDDSSELYPHFVSQTNVINLEQNGIPDCIKQWNKEGLETRNLFTDYLQSKGVFFEKRSNALEKIAEENITLQSNVEYEKVLSRVLQNPSKEVIENEAHRMDILQTFESADTSVKYHKLPNDAIKNWELTLEKTQSSIDRTNKHLESEHLSRDERKYFEHQKQIYEHLQGTFSDWGNGTINWLNDVKNTDINHLSL